MIKNWQKEIDAFLETVSSLNTTMKNENERLANYDMEGFRHLQDQKIETLSQYQISIERILQHKEELQNKVDDKRKDKLRAVQKELSELSAENLKLLKKCTRGAEKLYERIVANARKNATLDNARYGSSGHIYSSAQDRLSMGVETTA